MGGRSIPSRIPLERVLSGLDRVCKTSGGFLARCPAHEDHHPSLSISEGDDGRVLLHCWAGCETSSVVTAMGLSFADLYPRRPPRRRRG